MVAGVGTVGNNRATSLFAFKMSATIRELGPHGEIWCSIQTVT